MEFRNNKMAFYKCQPKSMFFLIIVLVFILFFIFYLSSKIKTYDHFITKGVVVCDNDCLITVFIPTNIDPLKFELNGKITDLVITDKVLEVNQDEMVSYYRLTINCNENFSHNEIVNFNFYYNKQSAFKKIRAKIF